MPGPKEKPSITLESLLQVKRNERPGSDFWNSFESNFERRRLNALVERMSLWDTFWTPALKALALGAPALLVLGLGVFWVKHQEPVRPAETTPRPLQIVSEPSMEAQAPQTEPVLLADAGMESASNQFVLDAIQDNSGRHLNFRKVLYTPAIQLSVPTGASYVKDSMSLRNYGVTTADLKLGRNF